jgi:hypothetical protein
VAAAAVLTPDRNNNLLFHKFAHSSAIL